MDPAEISQLIGELEERVERLRALYDQYFMGIERLEPMILRKDVDRRLWALRREQIRNTGLRFKLETTIQRYNTYQQYWQRIVREIENGTYQRDLGRAAQRFGENAVTAFAKRRQKMFEKGKAKRAERDAQRTRSSMPPPASDEAEPPSESYDVDFEDSGTSAEQPPLALDLGSSSESSLKVAPVSLPGPSGPAIARPPAPPAPALPGAKAPLRALSPPGPDRPAVKVTPASPGTMREVPGPGSPLPKPAPPPARPPLPSQSEARAPAPSAPDEALSATRLRQIYGQYVDAKRKANESTAALTFEKVAANLREAATQLRAKHKGAIDFEVVLKNGKPILKPVVKG